MKRKLLLHACCAPCSIAIIDELRSAYELAVLFYNPNVFPAEEYRRRKSEAVRVCERWQVPMIDLDYDNQAWEETVGRIPQDQERGPRCSACYRNRLQITAEYAKANGFNIFATSLSSGRQKKTLVVNAIGWTVAQQNGLDFLDTDWKKGGRWEKGLELVRQHQVYRQKYCGCRWSLERADDVRTE